MKRTSIAVTGLCWLLLVVGAVYLAALAEYPLVAQLVYVDENALMIGVAHNELGADDAQFMRRFDALLSAPTHTTTTTTSTQATTQTTTQTLKNTFLGLGMDAFTHTVATADSDSNDDVDVDGGGGGGGSGGGGGGGGGDVDIVTGILRAPANAARECIMLVVAFDDTGDDDDDDNDCDGEIDGRKRDNNTGAVAPSGVAIATALARHLGKVRWLSKDVVIGGFPFVCFSVASYFCLLVRDFVNCVVVLKCTLVHIKLPLCHSQRLCSGRRRLRRRPFSTRIARVRRLAARIP
jgi:hypothetical protein